MDFRKYLFTPYLFNHFIYSIPTTKHWILPSSITDSVLELKVGDLFLLLWKDEGSVLPTLLIKSGPVNIPWYVFHKKRLFQGRNFDFDINEIPKPLQWFHILRPVPSDLLSHLRSSLS